MKPTDHAQFAERLAATDIERAALDYAALRSAEPAEEIATADDLAEAKFRLVASVRAMPAASLQDIALKLKLWRAYLGDDWAAFAAMEDEPHDLLGSAIEDLERLAAAG